MKYFLSLFFFSSVYAFSKPNFFKVDKYSYKEYQKKWNKDSTDINTDYLWYQENVNYINQHNAKNDSSYVLTINDFTDKSRQSLKTTYFNQEFPSTKKMNIGLEQASFSQFSGNLPTRLDWREKNIITPVKNQGPCGSCWAFSAVGAIESKVALKSGKLENLSEQMEVDCSISNYGCRGGFMHTAFEDIMAMDGICLEKDYTYFARKGACSLDKPRVPGTALFGHNFILSHSIDALKKGVNKRPISIALNGDSRDFLFYGGGIIDNPLLSTRINHAVLLVGYSEEDKIPYWIIKNSWGKTWGEDGYVRIKMIDGKGIVGMNQYGVYPF